ncbi:DUF6427 family protein [Winogradskyella sp. 3972H.M.0a.05]|uniref:DUF6427 family protein n=1 Tax=Winogradskyella sp. 3972H.M.0a.05 TaxID=2950277 RepID=UPI003391A4C9
MISRFFSKSKPIHSIIIIVLICLVFFYVRSQYILEHLLTLEALKQLGVLLVAVFSVFVLDFIIGKNSLTQKNSYTILIYGLFIALVPNSLSNTSILLANVFILFALRRLISLHSKLSIKKKFFDATFWIAMASLCYFWAILFFALIPVALLYYSQNDIKNWMVPFVTLIGVAIIVVAFNILVYDNFLSDLLITPSISFDFSNYNAIAFIVAFTMIFTILMWTLVFYIKLIREVKGKLKPSYVLIGTSVLVALAIIIVSPLKIGSEFLFLFAPLAIIMTNYLERISDLRFKEVLLALLMITPIVVLLL